MEGEKERQRELREEKESNEAEDDTRSDDDADNEETDSDGSMLVWQESFSEDNLGLPIMHWEALSLRIAELEKQEEEKKGKMAKTAACPHPGPAPPSWREERGRMTDGWDGDDACNSHVLALTSRLQTQMNLQLCFINNSESEEEEEEKKGEMSPKEGNKCSKTQKDPDPAIQSEKIRSRMFRNPLKSLRERLRQHTKNPAAAAPSVSVVQRRVLVLRDLQGFSIKELSSQCASLSQDVQALSSELVSLLQVRDQLRTEQDAMLLEVQDLTSL